MLIPELKSAIFQRLSSDPILQGAVGTKIFDTRVPPGVRPPWIRFYIVSSGYRGAFQATRPLATAGFTVDVVTEGPASTHAEGYLARVESLLHGWFWESSEGAGWVRVDSHRKLWDDDGAVWILSADFVVLLRRKAP